MADSKQAKVADEKAAKKVCLRGPASELDQTVDTRRNKILSSA